MWARPLTNFQTTKGAQEVVRERRVHELENTYAQLAYSISVRAHSRVSGVGVDADKVEDGDVGKRRTNAQKGKTTPGTWNSRGIFQQCTGGVAVVSIR